MFSIDEGPVLQGARGRVRRRPRAARRKSSPRSSPCGPTRSGDRARAATPPASSSTQDVERLLEHYRGPRVRRGEGARRRRHLAAPRSARSAPPPRPPRPPRVRQASSTSGSPSTRGRACILVGRELRAAPTPPPSPTTRDSCSAAWRCARAPPTPRPPSAPTPSAWCGSWATPATRRRPSPPTSTARETR